MPSDLHESLADQGVKWFRRQGFGVIAADLAALGCRERADVVAFRSQCCAIIEAKASRADFFADLRKPERMNGGLGLYRFYICPPGLIQASELPAGWGLIYADGRKVTDVVRPLGNLWPGPGTMFESWAAFQHQNDSDAERSVLYSISRRLVLGKPIVKRTINVSGAEN